MTPLKGRSQKYNTDKYRLAGAQTQLNNFANICAPAALVYLETAFELIDEGLMKQYIADKALILNIPVEQVKVRHRPYTGGKIPSFRERKANG